LNGTSAFDFHATGTASGPYRGTFEESGHVVIGPQAHQEPGAPFPDAGWISISSTFTIVWFGQQITGSKTLSDTTYNYQYNEAVCATFPNPTADPAVTSGYAYGGTSDKLRYNVQLPGTGRCEDSGSSYVTFVDANYEWAPNGGPVVFNQFFESFTSKSGDTVRGCVTKP